MQHQSLIQPDTNSIIHLSLLNYFSSLSLAFATQNSIRLSGSTANPVMPTETHYVDNNFDVRSHYSDSAAVVATLYSLTATSGGGIGGVGTQTVGAPPARPSAASTAAATTTSTSAHHRSASITTSAGGGAKSASTRQPPPAPPLTTSSSQPFHTNSLHRKPDKLSIKSTHTAMPSAYATLQRPNGYFRSNQSLCSCNADSEVNAWWKRFPWDLQFIVVNCFIHLIS